MIPNGFPIYLHLVFSQGQAKKCHTQIERIGSQAPHRMVPNMWPQDDLKTIMGNIHWRV